MEHRNQLLSSLPEDDLAQFRRRLRYVPLQPGAVLHEAQSVIEHVYFPIEGMVSLLTKFQSGHVVDCAVVGCEGMLGGLAALGVPYAPHTATAQMTGAALAADVSDFMALVEENSTFREVISRFQAMQLLQAQQLAACNAVHNVEQRMCRWLLQIRDRTRGNVLPLKQEFLSHMLGVQRTTVTLVEQNLKAAGLVRQRRGRIELLDEEGLRAAACECYARMQDDYERIFPGDRDRSDEALAQHVTALAPA